MNWYEHGEKSHKYFLNLEKAKKKKSCVRKLHVDKDEYTTESKRILTEIHNFYSKLYDKNSYNLDVRSIDNFLNEVNIKKLSNEHEFLR